MDKRFPIEDQIAMLASALKGRVVVPGDADYDAVRAVVPGNYDPRPAPSSASPTPPTSRRSSTSPAPPTSPLAIRSGGHSGHVPIPTASSSTCATSTASTSTPRRADRLGRRRAHRRCGDRAPSSSTGSSSASAIPRASASAGSPPAAASAISSASTASPSTSLVAAEVVTASGDIVIADETNHPDLFWAVRGGGGNFGVVTRWKYQAARRCRPSPAARWCCPRRRRWSAAFVAAAEAAPEELSAITYVMTAPPLPFLPAELHGKVVYMCMMAFCRSSRRGAEGAGAVPRAATPIARPRRTGSLLQHVHAGGSELEAGVLGPPCASSTRSGATRRR